MNEDLPEDIKPFVKENMKRMDYQILGVYLIKRKCRKIKEKVCFWKK